MRDGACVTLDEAAIAAEIRAALGTQDRDALRERKRAADKLTPYIKKFYRGWEK